MNETEIYTPILIPLVILEGLRVLNWHKALVPRVWTKEIKQAAACRIPSRPSFSTSSISARICPGQ